MYRRRLALLIGATTCAVMAFSAAPPGFAADGESETTRDAGPALWSFSDEDTTVYLFGTIHLMQENVEWFEGDIRDTFEGSDTLVVEIDQTSVSRSEQRTAVRETALLPQEQRLSSIISEEAMSALMSLVEPLGVGKRAVERWKPWYAALTVVSVAARQEGFLPRHGVDATLMRATEGTEMEIRGLETVSYQLELFDELSREDAVYFLKDALEQSEKLGSFFEELKTAWLESNLSRLESVLLESQQENPEFYHSVYVERNRHWLPEITALLEEGGTHFVAVGSAHLVGENGLLEMLRNEGYQLKRR